MKKIDKQSEVPQEKTVEKKHKELPVAHFSGPICNSLSIIQDVGIFASAWSSLSNIPTKRAKLELPRFIDDSSSDFIIKYRRKDKSYKMQIQRTGMLRKYEKLNLRVEEFLKRGNRKLLHFEKIIYILDSFESEFEPEIMEIIKAKINFNNEEKIAVNHVFRSLKLLGDFGIERFPEINKTFIHYLDKYFRFAHENVVAMRFTEAILYSLCSLECESLFVNFHLSEDYFLNYFNKIYSPEIQLGAVVTNSINVKNRYNEKSNEHVTLFVLDIWKELNTKEAKSDTNFLGFSEKEITDCLYREITRLARFIRKCQESIYTILCQLLEGINLLDSSQIFQLPLVIMNVFNSTCKSKIFQCQFNPNKLQEEDRVALNCFYVSINILSKCCQASADIPFNEMILLETFEEFSHFISSNFISQRICESLLYCICNVVDKREIRNKGFSNFTIFEESFLDRKVSTEIKLASSFILSYLYLKEEEGIKSDISKYLMGILTSPGMSLHQSYCGFKEEEIQNCIGLLS